MFPEGGGGIGRALSDLDGIGGPGDRPGTGGGPPLDGIAGPLRLGIEGGTGVDLVLAAETRGPSKGGGTLKTFEDLS